jgi:hypothetical protein
MSTENSLTGRWMGEYYQHDRSNAIRAELVQQGEQLSGSMSDDRTASTYSVFEFASQAGLPPGDDEQIEARLRELFPDEPSAPIRYVTQLPPESTLEGWVRGDTVYFLKTYEGEHIGGFAVGERTLFHRIASHSVHYRGKLSPDGQEIEGRWWIDPLLEPGAKRTEGSFILRRESLRPQELDSERL